MSGDLGIARIFPCPICEKEEKDNHHGWVIDTAACSYRLCDLGTAKITFPPPRKFVSQKQKGGDLFVSDGKGGGFKSEDGITWDPLPAIDPDGGIAPTGDDPIAVDKILADRGAELAKAVREYMARYTCHGGILREALRKYEGKS